MATNTNYIRDPLNNFNNTTIVRGFNGEETNFFNWGTTEQQYSEVPRYLSGFREGPLLVYRQQTIVPDNTPNQLGNQVGIEIVLKAKKVGVCSICQEDLKQGETIRILDCMHKYHKNCVDRWLSQHSNSCPECRHQSKSN